MEELALGCGDATEAERHAARRARRAEHRRRIGGGDRCVGRAELPGGLGGGGDDGGGGEGEGGGRVGSGGGGGGEAGGGGVFLSPGQLHPEQSHWKVGHVESSAQVQLYCQAASQQSPE